MTARRAIRAFAILAVTVIVAQAGSCPGGSSPSPPAPASATFAEVLTDIGRGGRSIAVSISAADPQTAIVGTESGGLYRTTNRGNTWTHVDGLAPFRIQDVAFAEPGMANLQVVFATVLRDAMTTAAANNGGVWRSVDGGVTWAHVSAGVCPVAHSAFGITLLGANGVFVATDCGVMASNDLGVTWTTLPTGSATTVLARATGAAIQLDVCVAGSTTRLLRSVNGGSTFTTISTDMVCDGPHNIAMSPTDLTTMYAVFPNRVLRESRDGGATWPTNLGATTFNNRREWVRTRPAIDGNAANFNLHYSGRIVTCSNAGTPRCPANVLESWPRLPNSALNHDINGIAFQPGGACPVFMAADYGVYRAGPAIGGLPCGDPSQWTHPGTARNGLHSLQIYQVAGQLHYPISGPGITSTGAATNLHIGTMDNLVWSIWDAGPTGWQPHGAEGSFLQVLYENPLLPPSDLQLTYMELGRIPAAAAVRLVPRSGGTWNQPVNWTSFPVPGNGMPPILIEPHTYVQWSLSTLFLTTDGGASFTAPATLPPNPSNPAVPLTVPGFGATQVAATPAGPAVYEVITDGTSSGLALITRVTTPGPPRTLEVRTFGGTSGQGLSSGPSGLSGVLSHCFGQAIYCQPVYAVDPADYRNLIAVDLAGAVARTHDAGRTWQPITSLNNLATMNGAVGAIDANGWSQVRAIAFNPKNTQQVLAGTDQTGVFASSNGGLTWSALPNTARATAITSFFFDDRTKVVYVATYGRGLWRLTVDWSTVR